MNRFLFENKLINASIVKRNSQFTLDVEIDGHVEKAHCPTTGRIGNVDLKNIPCLLSISDNPKRKTRYTLEAISVDDSALWIGVNQIASNRYVEFFLQNNLLSDMLDNYENISREVKKGSSKLDFLIDNVYMEVKTPLQTLQVEYADNIKLKKTTPFSSTDRFLKHIKDLTDSLNTGERAILLTVFQYDNPGYEIINPSVNRETVYNSVKECVDNGLEIWQLNLGIDNEGVCLLKYWNLGIPNIKF